MQRGFEFKNSQKNKPNDQQTCEKMLKFMGSMRNSNETSLYIH